MDEYGITIERRSSAVHRTVQYIARTVHHAMDGGMQMRAVRMFSRKVSTDATLLPSVSAEALSITVSFFIFLFLSSRPFPLL